jgi:hypothetical protein
MKTKEAQVIINSLFDKLDTTDESNLFHWKIEARSITELLFGKESHEYDSIASFYNKETVYNSVVEKVIAKRKEIQSLKSLRNIFINTLNIKGVYKKPKSNMVSHLKNWQLIGFIIAIFLAGFGAYKTIEEISDKGSIIPIPSNIVPSDISNADTNSKNNTERKKKIVFDSVKLGK